MKGLSCKEMVSELCSLQMSRCKLRNGFRFIPSSLRAGKFLEAVDSSEGRASPKRHREVLKKNPELKSAVFKVPHDE